MFKGRKVIVLGAAKSGISAAEVLVKLGADVTLTDRTPLHEMSEADRSVLQNMNIRLVTGSHPESLLDGADLIVKNPGISPGIPFLQAAKDRGVPWISELELAWQVTQAEVVAITGTNGKTTTTALTGEIFAGGSRPVAVGGNIGVALTGISFGKSRDWVLVVETSSFQLEDCHQFKPRVAVFTNITPDHLNRHKTMDNYIAAKLRLVHKQTEEDYVVVNLDDPQLTSLSFGKGQQVGYSLDPGKGADCWVEDGWFWWRGTKIAPTECLRIHGRHNLQNALAAIASAAVMKVEPQAIARGLENFPGVEHRLEFSGEHRGIRFYNDSKATNPESTAIALQSFTQKVLLLAGGSDKGSDYGELVPLFREKVRHLFTYGHTGDTIRRQAVEGGYEAVSAAQDLPGALQLALAHAEPGDIILLSPACASYDQYSNFEERGRHFKALVKNLGG